MPNVFKMSSDRSRCEPILASEGLPVKLLPFSPRQQRRVVDLDGGAYGSKVPLNFTNFIGYGLVPADFRLVHVIVPDSAGKFPGDDGVDMRFFNGIPSELLEVDASSAPTLPVKSSKPRRAGGKSGKKGRGRR